MKNLFPLVLLLLTVQACKEHPTESQSISLPKEVKFKMGDNIDWATSSYNDNDWETKSLGKSWATTEVLSNVYAWYRIKIVIPSSLKNGKGLKLNLGKIDDVDQTYFNGKLIGQTGTLPPNYETKWDEERVYTINENSVQWNQENTIAVRVFSLDIGGVGMYAGSYNLEPIGWKDEVAVQQDIVETANNGFTTKITFTNKTESTFNGKVEYWVTNKANSVLLTETKPIRLQSRKGAESVVSFTNFESQGEDVFKVGYRIHDSNSALTSEKEQMYVSNSHIQIPVGKEVLPIIENKITNIYTPIAFQSQHLQGYLGQRMTKNLEERLLNVDEDGLTGSYLSRPGIHPWAGEHIGKYLETASNVWKYTHDPRLKQQMDRMMYKLINSQLEDGYLGTYMPEDYWTSWDVWSHKYNLYGLLAYYATTGYPPALEVSKKMGDLLCTTFGTHPGQRDIILAGEHMGMAATSVLDPMVDLYRYTGDKKYLDFCYYILDAWEQDNGPKIISSSLATWNVAKVGNGKAYEMLSNFVGLVKLYQVTGDEKLLKPALIAWQDIVDKKMYITGTASSREHFQGDDDLPATERDNMGEGCVTTTWLQFNQNLLAVTGDLKYYDQIEKSIYNHLLAAENPETGCVSYYTPLMGKKPYTCFITCCQSSVPRGIGLIPNFTFGNIKNVPVLMQYESATYKENIATTNGKNIDLSLKIEGDFLKNGNAVVTVNTSNPADFSINLRVPAWSASFLAIVGGKTYKGKANEYLEIKRLWKSGDKINVSFLMPIQTIDGGKSYPNQIAFQRGPQVLAFDDTLNTKSTFEKDKSYAHYSFERTIVTDLLPKQWIGNQVYKVKIKDNQSINLVPFADASQTGGDMRVWLPVQIKK